jgi:hypothetical protein
MKDVLSFVAAVVAWYGLWIAFKRMRRNWRQFVAEHPPVPYLTSAVVEPWRWSDPQAVARLVKEDSADYSLLRLPNIRNSVNVLGTIAGVAMLLGAVYLFIYAFHLAPAPDLEGGRVFLMVCLVLAGRGMLFLNSRLVAIELHRDHAVFIVRYGIILFKRITYHRGRPTFSGEIQSALTMERYQAHPNYYVYATRWWLQKRYVTDCDPSQGSWLIAGLQHWKDCVPVMRAG